MFPDFECQISDPHNIQIVAVNVNAVTCHRRTAWASFEHVRGPSTCSAHERPWPVEILKVQFSMYNRLFE